MNIFNFKAKLLPANYHGHKYLPTISVGGVLRTNDPFVVQAVKHKNATNGDVYLVGTKLFMIGKKFGFVGSAGVRGTNAQKYGYGGNTVDWEARAFGGIAFPIPIKNVLVITPAFEVDQEPRRLKYVPTASLPTDLVQIGCELAAFFSLRNQVSEDRLMYGRISTVQFEMARTMPRLQRHVTGVGSSGNLSI